MSAAQQPASTWARWRHGLPNASYHAFFTIYAAGLVLWLTLGLLPTLISEIPEVAEGFDRLSDGDGAMADRAAHALHIPSTGWSVAVILGYGFGLLNFALGLLLAVRRPNDLVPRLLAVAFLGTAATFNAASHDFYKLLDPIAVVTWLHFAFHVVSGVAYLWAVILFPDGRLPIARSLLHHRYGLASAMGLSTVLIAWLCYWSSFQDHTPFFVKFFGVLIPCVALVAQTVRLRDPDLSPTVAQQARLLRGALAPAFVVAVVWLISQPVSSSPAIATVGAVAGEAFPAMFAVVPAVLFVAIFRYRLWDLDFVLSRTLLVTLLSVFVGVVYAATLAIAGGLSRNHGWSVVLAMTVVAIGVEPLRVGAGRLANRLVYGQELTPREALRTLAERLKRPTTSNELTELTQVVVAGTRCSSAAVWLLDADGVLLLAATPELPDADHRLPLAEPTLACCRAQLPTGRCLPVTHEGRLVATLVVTVPEGVALPQAEERLLQDLAGHAGMLVANARLTTQLASQLAVVTAYADDLRRSRHILVAAQDQERRRLERDLHDGAQQELVALLIDLATAQRSIADREPVKCERLRCSIEESITTLRELCHGAPTILTRDGLSAALDEVAAPIRRSGLTVDLELNLPRRLPADVESAIYFCCSEAMQNVAKHARASTVVVTVTAIEDRAELSVSDDGSGFDLTAVSRSSGLAHFAQRAAVLGGVAEVSSAVGGGTRVTCAFPLVELRSEPHALDRRDLVGNGH